MFKKILNFEIKFAKILFLLLVVSMVFLGFYAQDLKLNSDFSTLVPQDSTFNVGERKLELMSVSNDAMVLLITHDENSQVLTNSTLVSTPYYLNYYAQIKEILPQSQYVVEVVGPIYSANEEKAQFILQLESPNGAGSTALVKEEISSYLDELQTPPASEVVVTGFPVIIDRVATLLITDNLKTIVLTFLFVSLILYWYSRDIYFTLIGVSTPLFSLLSLGALMVFLNIELTITLAAVGVLVLALGADYAIHISVQYNKAIKRFKEHKKALTYTLEELKLPLFASYLTTLGGFIALVLGVSPSSQAQGIVLSLGITLIFLISMLGFPILMSVFSSHMKVKDNKTFSSILTFLATIARVQLRYSKLVLWGIAAVTLVMMYGASQVQFSTSNSNWIPDGDPISDSFRELNFEFGEQDNLYLLIESTSGDLRNVQTLRDINELLVKLEGINQIEEIRSPFSSIGYSKREVFDEITYNQSRKVQFNQDYTFTKISLISYNLGQDEAGKSLVLKEVKEIISEQNLHQAEVSVYGNAVRFEELGDSLQKDAGITTFIGLSLVFLVASLVYASLIVGALALIPIVLAVIWTVGLMGFFGVPFTSLSTGIISLVLGIGVDFSIHLVDSIKRYSNRMKFELAVFETMNSSGRAIILSSLTSFVGFMSLSFATLLGTQRLGFSLAFSIVSVVILSLLIIPTVLNLVHKRREKKLTSSKK